MKIVAIEYTRNIGDEKVTVMAEVMGEENPETAFFDLRNWTEDRAKTVTGETDERVKALEELTNKRNELDEVIKKYNTDVTDKIKVNEEALVPEKDPLEMEKHILDLDNSEIKTEMTGEATIEQG